MVAVIGLEASGDPVAVVDGEGVEDGPPGVDPAYEVLPVLPLLGGGQVEDLHGRLLGREVPAVADGPPEPGVQRLYGVRRIDDRPQLGRELEERDELVPVSHDEIMAG